MRRATNLPGIIISLAFSLAPVTFWLTQKPLNQRFGNFILNATSTGQILGLVGLSMFAVSLIISSRLKIIDSLFGGMNRAYIIHHIFGSVALILLLFHPLLLAAAFFPVSWHRSALLLLPGTDWAINLGITAQLLLISLLLLTVYRELPYHLWRATHKFLGLTFFIGGLHSLFVTSDTSVNLPLRYYLITLSVTALLLHLYRTVFGRFFVPRLRYTVQKVNSLENHIVEFELIPKNPDRVLRFLPGQFMFIQFLSPRLGESHLFSILSSPGNPLKLAVKSLGDYTNRLRDIPIGGQALVDGPFGRFISANYPYPQIWIAGGIGITPFISMAEGLTVPASVDLYYVIKDPGEAVYLGVLQKLASQKSGFRIFPHFSKNQGRFTAETIISNSPVSDKEIFLCGPPPMMHSLRLQLNKLGIRNSHIHSEEFSLD